MIVLFERDITYAHFELDQWLQIRVQAIRGLPLLGKDTPEYVPKTVDVLGQLLYTAGNSLLQSSLIKLFICLF